MSTIETGTGSAEHEAVALADLLQQDFAARRACHQRRSTTQVPSPRPS